MNSKAFGNRWKTAKKIALGSLFLAFCLFVYYELSSQTVLTQALDSLESDHLNSKNVDWASLRTEATAIATTRGTREAIDHAINKLGEKHTFYRPVGNAFQAAIDNTSPSAIESAVAGISGRMDRNVAIIVVPHFSYYEGHPTTKQFMNKMNTVIGELSKSEPQAWIIDLRANTGGNMWVMIAGLACFFEPGLIGASRDSQGTGAPWLIDNDRTVGIKARWMFHAQGKNEARCPSILRKQALAVLVGANTASSAEAVAISLLSRPNTVLYGTTTAGFATMNEVKKLSDGSMLAVTTYRMHDTLGRSFPNGIDPGQLGTQGRAVRGTEDPLEIAIAAMRGNAKL